MWGLPQATPAKKTPGKRRSIAEQLEDNLFYDEIDVRPSNELPMPFSPRCIEPSRVPLASDRSSDDSTHVLEQAYAKSKTQGRITRARLSLKIGSKR